VVAARAVVDEHTERLIQQLLRNEFKSCTVLHITHRAALVEDYDRVIVIDDGR
jgi:ABC-type multidrug transport system fused ATPase/permease subunit